MSLVQKIENAKPYGKLFQGLLAILANHMSGVKINKDFHPQLIFKCEGGVKVNGEEIVVTFDSFEGKIYCYNDFNNKELNISNITALATEKLLTEIDWTSLEENSIKNQIFNYFLKVNNIDLTEDELTGMISSFYGNPFGDPLRSLFDL